MLPAFLAISITLFGFSSLGIYFLIIEFLNSLTELIVCLAVFLISDWSVLIKSFAKNDRFWYPKYLLNILLLIPFASFMISLIKESLLMFP